MPRCVTWGPTIGFDGWDGITKIELSFTDIGHITITRDRRYPSYIFIQLGNQEIPFSLYESDYLDDAYMEFEDGMLTRQPLVDVMEVFANMTDDDLTNLVAQLFDIEVKLRDKPYTVHPKPYRIVA